MSDLIKILTHSADAQARLLFQYKNSPNLKNFIDALFGQQVQELENAIYELLDRLDINEASGEQLNKIGIIVGQDRLGLSDELYRLFLKARIGKNVSESEGERIISVWQLISQSNSIHLVEAFPCEIDLYYDTPISEALVPYAFDLIQDVAGAGIRIEYIAVFDTDNAFSFASDKINANGFGDYYNTLIGGELSYIQNINEYPIGYVEPVFGFEPSDPDVLTLGFGDYDNPHAPPTGKFAWLITD